jgi:hypothetical protein
MDDERRSPEADQRRAKGPVGEAAARLNSEGGAPETKEKWARRIPEPQMTELVTGRPFRLTLRIVALGVILVGPIAAAAWELHSAERIGGEPAPRDEERYLARRNPVVDQQLPQGQGGIRFVEDLDGSAGMAFSRAAAIALAASVTSDPWPESIELHERAHLLHAFLPGAVAPLLARMPPPAATEYAATNRREHFAEMAATAWQLVVPPEGMCVEGTTEETLRAAEARVPGTAGFVVWYLRRVSPADAARADTLRTMAAQAIAPHRAEWEGLWQAMDARRRSDGTFDPWRVQTVRQYLEGQRAAARASGLWMDHVGSVALAPSLLVLSIAGR